MTKPQDLRRAELLKGIFKPVNEVDTGQETTNPYILALRHYKGKTRLDLDGLNAVLAYHGITITQQEFDLFSSMKAVSLPYPLPNNDQHVHSVIGTMTKQKVNMVAGVYVLTLKQDGRQYVGSSGNISMRLRTYYNTKAKVSGRTMAGLMSSLGPTAFNLDVYILPLGKFVQSSPMSDHYRTTLILALEQYLILTLKPLLNDMLVVGGGQTKYLGESLVLASTTSNSKLLYVYNADKTQLLYVDSSRIDFETELGVNTKTQANHIRNDTPLLGAYHFSESPIEGASSAIISTAELLKAMKLLYQSSPGVKHSVTVTDLRFPGQDVRSFDSKAKALKYTVSKGRPVGKTFLAKLPCTHNGWLIEPIIGSSSK